MVIRLISRPGVAAPLTGGSLAILTLTMLESLPLASSIVPLFHRKKQHSPFEQKVNQPPQLDYRNSG